MMPERSAPSRALRRVGVALLLWLALIGCTLGAPSSPPTPLLPTPTAANPTAPPMPTLTATSSPLPAATPTPRPADSGWRDLDDGLAERVIDLRRDDGTSADSVYLLRIDPARYRFNVGYAPGAPRALSDWLAQTGAAVVINGGFFTESFTATGLVVVDGVASGVSYGAFAGMVAVDADGALDLRWLAAEPYDSAETLHAAFQSFPMLVKPGGMLGFSEESGQRARRAAIGRTTGGDVILLVTERGSFTLHGLSRWLVASDLDLDIALNLDGGTSAGVLVAPCTGTVPCAGAPRGVYALVPLPTVLTVHRR